MLKTTGINIEPSIFMGNPTCPHCGVTYPMAQQHYCPQGQQARLDGYKAKIDEQANTIKILSSTLRDQFAMAALNGLCGLNWVMLGKTEVPTAKDHASMAYKYADAMLAERRKG